MEKRNNVRLLLRNLLMIAVGSAIFSLGFDLFLEPAGISCGGVSGIAMLIVYATKSKFLTVGILSALINLPLFFFGYHKIGKLFFFGSLLGMVVTSVGFDLFARILPIPKTEPLVAAIFGGVIIGEYGYYESCQELVTRILKVFCDSTLPVLQKSRDAYDENPYLVEDFYDLCGRTIQNTPALFFRDTNMLLLVTQAAVQGIQLQHREANNSLMRYLESLLSYGQEVEKEEGELALNPINYRDRVLSVLSVCGQEMMNQLVAALTGGLPESRLKDSNVSVVSVLYNYYDYFNDLFIQAMANTIATIPERILSSAEKHQFMAVGEGRGDDA